MSLTDFKPPIAQFWDLEDTEQTDLLTKIRRYANSQKSKDFAQEVNQHFDQVLFSGIEVIYEALSDEPKKWGGFFVKEYRRAFQAAEKAPNPFEILECLDEIGFADLEATAYNDQIIELIQPYLDHDNLAILYKALWNLGDFLTPSILDQHAGLEDRIKQQLSHKNWKIRFAASTTLEELDRLPSDYKVSFWDQWKIRFLDPYHISYNVI